MAEIDANEGLKRRLPSWMSGANATDRSSKSDSNSSKIVVSVGEDLSKDDDRSETNPRKGDRKKKPRNRDQRVNRGDAEISDEEGLHKKKRTLKKRNLIEDEIESEKPVRRKKGKSKSYELGNGEEDDEELTVEDLISIAEEYVKKADNDDDSKDHRIYTRLSSITDVNGHEPDYSTSADPKRGTAYFSASPSNFSSSIDVIRDGATKGNEETLAVADAGFCQRITGDPTQDMLELLLGPLLTQARVEERKVETVAEDIALHSELIRREALQEKVVPLVAKKKSSLKDKVTLFLD